MDSAMITFLSQYGLLAIFIIITLEYACFPISSEVVLPVSGLIAAQLHHKITVVILISVVAGIIRASVILPRAADALSSRQNGSTDFLR